MSCAAPRQALAWGATGHRLIARAAVSALPDEIPAFLRTAEAVQSAGELAREPDRWKDAGRAHDVDRDTAHFLDVADDGTIFGGPTLSTLPETRVGYENALRAVGADSWKAGWLPYSIIDGWQQLAKDFAYWRVETEAADHVADASHRAWIAADRAEREKLVLRDLGVLAHYVGDGSQPLHVTVHFNGWGLGPNPEGFTQDRVHAPFEGQFVRQGLDEAQVRAAMAPYRDCRCEIRSWTSAYLSATHAQVVPFYRLEKAGAFRSADSRGRAFAAARLGAGASALRDLVVDAWRASASGRVGWPAIGLTEVRAGADPYDSLYGTD